MSSVEERVDSPVSLLVAADEDLFVEVLSRFCPRRHVVRYADDLAEAEATCQAHGYPTLIIARLDGPGWQLTPVLRQARARQTRVVGVVSSDADFPSAVDRVVRCDRDRVEEVIAAACELLSERRRWPRAEVDVEVALQQGRSAVARVSSAGALFVPTDDPLDVGCEVEVVVCCDGNQAACLARVVRVGVGSGGQPGMALEVPEGAARVQLDAVVRRALIAGHRQQAADRGEPLAPELVRKLAARARELLADAFAATGEAGATTTEPASDAAAPERIVLQVADQEAVDPPADQADEVVDPPADAAGAIDAVDRNARRADIAALVERQQQLEARVDQLDAAGRARADLIEAQTAAISALDTQLVALPGQVEQQVDLAAIQVREEFEEVRAALDAIEVRVRELAERTVHHGEREDGLDRVDRVQQQQQQQHAQLSGELAALRDQARAQDEDAAALEQRLGELARQLEELGQRLAGHVAAHAEPRPDEPEREAALAGFGRRVDDLHQAQVEQQAGLTDVLQHSADQGARLREQAAQLEVLGARIDELGELAGTFGPVASDDSRDSAEGLAAREQRVDQLQGRLERMHQSMVLVKDQMAHQRAMLISLRDDLRTLVRLAGSVGDDAATTARGARDDGSAARPLPDQRRVGQVEKQVEERRVASELRAALQELSHHWQQQAEEDDAGC